jgi:hypothetical protein
MRQSKQDGTFDMWKLYEVQNWVSINQVLLAHSHTLSCCLWLLFFFFLAVLYHLSHALNILLQVIFQAMSLCCPGQTLDLSPPTAASWVAGIPGMCHHAWLIFWDRFSPHPFFPGLVLNCNCPISAYWIAGITGVMPLCTPPALPPGSFLPQWGE